MGEPEGAVGGEVAGVDEASGGVLSTALRRLPRLSFSFLRLPLFTGASTGAGLGGEGATLAVSPSAVIQLICVLNGGLEETLDTGCPTGTV